jgi:ABC-2 type transport system ATP-binding protein
MTYTTTGPTIEATGVTKAFGDVAVLSRLDLRAEAGSVVALLGPNGAGKTTTVRILATLTRADAGTVRVAGHDVAREPRKVREAISLTGQYAAVDELLTGRENLRMMARLRRLRGAAARRRTAELLERFDIVDARDRRVATYSGGMRRRLDLAVSLVSEPPVVFLDEPTTGLDPRSRRAMWAGVGELRDAGVTVLLTTQNLDEADRLADRVAVIDGGRVIAEGTAGELKGRTGGETVVLHLADKGAIRLPTDGSAAAVRAVLDQMERRGVAVERLELQRPSLDDVFLTLTERS